MSDPEIENSGFLNHCGHRVSEDMKYCAQCGALVVKPDTQEELRTILDKISGFESKLQDLSRTVTELSNKIEALSKSSQKTLKQANTALEQLSDKVEKRKIHQIKAPDELKVDKYPEVRQTGSVEVGTTLFTAHLNNNAVQDIRSPVKGKIINCWVLRGSFCLKGRVLYDIEIEEDE